MNTHVIHRGDCLEQLRNLPDRCVDLIYIDPPSNSNRNYEVFRGKTRDEPSFGHRRTRDMKVLTPTAQ